MNIRIYKIMRLNWSAEHSCRSVIRSSGLFWSGTTLAWRCSSWDFLFSVAHDSVRIWCKSRHSHRTLYDYLFMPLKDQSNSTVMKPAVDEMFPEGAGPYVDLDEVCLLFSLLARRV